MFNYAHVAPPQTCFTFSHWWNSSESETLERCVSLEFTATEESLIHGFAGYFSATLFEGVEISILPETFSEGMFSWFPLFLPLRAPLRVEKGEKIQATLWRKCSAAKVWYEWCAETEHATSQIHNPNGRSYAVNLLT
jgi:protein arginine N-methyltransferase 5